MTSDAEPAFAFGDRVGYEPMPDLVNGHAASHGPREARGRVAVWHVITGEYPPVSGGVSDYSRLIAAALAAADDVHVWTPACAGTAPDNPGVAVHRLPGHFGPRALQRLGRALDAAPTGRLLVQYVPHAFGYKAMNLPFCLWLFRRRRAVIDVMFHEVAFPIRRRQPLRHNLLALVERMMALLVARAATRIFVASPAWEPMLRPYLPRGHTLTWLPVPSNIPVVDDVAEIAAMRNRYARADGLILGHFGTYAPEIAAALARLPPALMRDHTNLSMVLAGGGSVEFRDRLLRENPELAPRLFATGRIGPTQLSLVLSACDLMVQPYPDGVSTRRTSMMAVLAHRRAAVTTSGIFTEPLWDGADAAMLVPAGNDAALRAAASRLLADPAMRQCYSLAARRLYDERFDICHTTAAIRVSPGA